MNSSLRALLALAALLSLGTVFAWNIDPPCQEAAPGAVRELTPQQRKDLRRKLTRGLSFEQVRGLLGPPHRVARQILSHRCLEQWVYGPPYDFRIEFDCPRGQKPQLLATHPLRPE